jgi:RHS repeat-associated protein
MMMPERKFSAASTYRYGFNGKEMDNEVKEEGAQFDYGFRIYDPRLGRFLSVDPLTKKYPELTPYQFAGNRCIQGIDLDGKEVFLVTGSGQGFFLFNGAEIGGGIAFGKDGIALVAYETVKIGFGLELGASVNGTLYPGMQNLKDLDGVAWGGSVSGAYLGKFGVGVSNSSGNWGATVSVGVGVGAHASVDASIIIGLKVITWDQIMSKLSESTDAGKALKAFFGINDKNKSNTIHIVKDYYTKMAIGLRDKRLGDLRTENKKNEQTIKSANSFLEDYNKSGFFYKLATFGRKRVLNHLRPMRMTALRKTTMKSRCWKTSK